MTRSTHTVPVGMLPILEDGETIYSWASRTHLLLGHSVGWLSNALFGNIRASRAYDLPVGIAHLDRVTGGLLGEPRDLVARRSPVGGFLPYLGESRRQSIIDSIVAGNRPLAALLIGVRASRLSGTFPLRSCSACVRIDRDEVGAGRWRVAHQLPAMWMCLDHGILLTEHRGTAFGWHLPSGDEGVQTSRLNFDAFSGAIHAAAAVSAAGFEVGEIQLHSLRQAAIERLCHIGLVSNPSRLPIKKLHQAFLASPIGQAISEYEHVRALVTSEVWLADLLRGRVSSHPVKWTLLWSWIWADAAARETARSFSEAARGMVTGGISSTQMELPLDGLDRAERICVERIVDAMQLATSHEDIARLTGSSETDVSRWFRRYPALRQRWMSRVRQMRRSSKLSQVEATVEKVQPTSRVELLASCGADIRWLRRHEPAVAEKLLVRIPAERSSQLSLFRPPARESYPSVVASYTEAPETS